MNLIFTEFSVELANSARFISEITGFLHVVHIKKSYQGMSNA